MVSCFSSCPCAGAPNVVACELSITRPSQRADAKVSAECWYAVSCAHLGTHCRGIADWSRLLERRFGRAKQ